MAWFLSCSPEVAHAWLPVTEPIVACSSQYRWTLVMKKDVVDSEEKTDTGESKYTNLSGALDILCVASDETGVLVVVVTVGLSRHLGCCVVLSGYLR